MANGTPISELEFLRLTSNHREFARKLAVLGYSADEIREHAVKVCRAWFRLAEQHLEEAESVSTAGGVRSVYSRSYYAAYNASKSARYMSKGVVSLAGDDHGKASADLPADFPDQAESARSITVLYIQRLRADYDNWSDIDYDLSPTDALESARKIVEKARSYLMTVHGVQL